MLASETWAYEEATRLYRQALALSDGGADSADATRLELALAAALYRSGDLAGSHRTALAVGQRAERARDAMTLAQTALVMEATGEPAWDAAMARICEAALASGDLPAPVTARVLARYGQVLAYRNEATRAERSEPRSPQAPRMPPTIPLPSSKPSMPASWPGAVPTAWPSGQTWRSARCGPGWRPVTPGSRCGPGSGESTPCSRPVNSRRSSASSSTSNRASNDFPARSAAGTICTPRPRSPWRPPVSARPGDWRRRGTRSSR